MKAKGIQTDVTKCFLIIGMYVRQKKDPQVKGLPCKDVHVCACTSVFYLGEGQTQIFMLQQHKLYVQTELCLELHYKDLPGSMKVEPRRYFRPKREYVQRSHTHSIGKQLSRYCFIYLFIYFIFRHSLTMQALLTQNFLCKSGWLQTQ